MLNLGCSGQVLLLIWNEFSYNPFVGIGTRITGIVKTSFLLDFETDFRTLKKQTFLNIRSGSLNKENDFYKKNLISELNVIYKY